MGPPKCRPGAARRPSSATSSLPSRHVGEQSTSSWMTWRWHYSSGRYSAEEFPLVLKIGVRARTQTEKAGGFGDELLRRFVD